MQEHPPQDSGGYWRSLKKKEDSKGFTLVELIVVIVILAILAAILIPGLLKWIDQAKDKKYELEAREIAMAAEAALTQMYGQGAGALDLVEKDGHYLLKAGGSTDLMKYSPFSGELGKFTEATVKEIRIYGNSDGGTPKKWGGSVSGFEIAFKASDDAEITARLSPDDDRWVINGSSGGSDEGPSESTENEDPDSDVPVIRYDAGTKTVTISGKGDITGDSITELAQYKEAETVVIRYGITGIGAEAFDSYANLESITIPSGVTSIGNFAFFQCSSLTSITIPSGVTSIGNFAFFQCSSLTSITIPSGVTSIGESAFCQCDSLESITIPSTVTSIGQLAFVSIASPKTYNFGGTEDQWNALKNDTNIEVDYGDTVNFNS